MEPTAPRIVGPSDGLVIKGGLENGLETDGQLELRWLLNGKSGRLDSLEDAIREVLASSLNICSDTSDHLSN